MHLRDLRRALRADLPWEPSFAADGIDEVVAVFFPRQVRLERTPPLASGVRLVATDVPGATWVLADDGTDAQASYDATLSGTAAALLLWLWGRSGGAPVSVEGDASAVDAARAAALTP